MQHILIDTDVILDFFFDRQPFSEAAAQLLNLCEKKQVKGFITSVALSNIYYLLRKTAGHDKVIKHLQKLLQIVDVAVTDKAVALQATSADFKDFEDALQNFTAEKAGIKIVITRNIKDYKTSKLLVLTAESFFKLL